MPVSALAATRAFARLGLVAGIVAAAMALPPESLNGATKYGVGIALAVVAGLGSGTSP
jgi:hypothetical protein